MVNSVTNWLEYTSQKYPNKIAFADECKALTFAEVRYQAIALASMLCNYGRRQPIVVYMDKSVDMLVAYLGIAYSGNFYCPIATDMPESRTQRIMNILKPAAIICMDKHVNDIGEGCKIGFDPKRVYSFGKLATEQVEEQNILNVSKKILSTDLLYVLFTSGSTGEPKGVAVTHGSVIDYIDWVTEEFSISSEDRFGNQAPFYFDNSILDIYSCVKTGASLHIVPAELFSQPVNLLQYLLDQKINTIFWVPSALIVVSKLKAFRNVDISGTLKRVMFCGEVMPNKQLNIWRKYLPNAMYVNLYGPTEITDACTFFVVDREFSDEEPLPIGNPMPNTEILVLNEKNELVKPGENGELCVRGVSLAVGYYNNPEKTREVFVQNPLNKTYPEFIYKTGDIVHYNEMGELVYVCRKDFQIKHMGHRIELGEIENAVCSLDGVANGCCLYDEKRQKIVLFIETLDERIDRHFVLDGVKKMLPDYMYPNKVITISKFPLNTNGKIDRIELRNSYLKC